MGNQVCCPPSGNQGVVDYRAENKMALKKDNNPYGIGGYIPDSSDAQETPRGGDRTFDTDGTDPANKDGAAVSQGSAQSTQPSQKKVVINYADLVNEQGIPETKSDVAQSDRSQSNVSNGYNHAPNSPMRHRSSNNYEPGEAEWPQSQAKKTQALFREELEGTDGETGMVFDSNTSPKFADSSNRAKLGKEDDMDSLVSGHSSSRLEKKANLELVWQKANSINGIRKMNMQFKEERRQYTALDEREQITQDYWQVCETFIQMIELKQIENLKILTASARNQDQVHENIKSEINTYQHKSIGLGRRMPVPENIDVHQAVKLQRQLMDRVIHIYAKNSQGEDMDVYRVQKVCQCIADDEFVKQTGYEPEQIEIFLFFNRQMVRELSSERSQSYDYLQKDGENSDKDWESHQSNSFNEQMDGLGQRKLSRQTDGEDHPGLNLPEELAQASLKVHDSVARPPNVEPAFGRQITFSGLQESAPSIDPLEAIREAAGAAKANNETQPESQTQQEDPAFGRQITFSGLQESAPSIDPLQAIREAAEAAKTNNETVPESQAEQEDPALGRQITFSGLQESAPSVIHIPETKPEAGEGETQPAEQQEEQKDSEENSQLSESEEEEQSTTHTPVVIQSAAKTPRLYNDEQKENMQRASILQTMQEEGGFGGQDFDGY